MIDGSRQQRQDHRARPAPDGAPVSRRRFAGEESGIAAVEFALILPIMLILYLGLVELSRGMRAAQKVDLVAHALADLTAQQLYMTRTPPLAGNANGQAALTEADIQAIFAAGTALLAPLPAAALKMTITEVNITSPSANNWQAQATWTVRKNSGTARPCTVLGASNAAPIQSGAMPTSYTQVTNGVNPVVGPVIVADVSYAYSTGMNYTFQFSQSLGYNSISNLTFNRTSYSAVRNTFTPPHIQYFMTSGTNCQAPTP
jgi:Flp pilus assembly protein TadG